MNYWTKFIIVMVAVTLADICWTMYFLKTEERAPHHAGFWSALIMLCSSVVTTNYVHEPSLVVAAMLGAYIGTAGIIGWKKRKERQTAIERPLNSATTKMLLLD